MTSDTLTTRQRGGQPNNRNRTRHGLRASGLPKGCSYLAAQLTTFRRSVRDELVRCHGEVGLYQEAILQSACRHEQRALLVSRWLRIENDKLTIDQRAALLRDLSSATTLRDRCLQLLKLDDRDVHDTIEALYAPTPVDTGPGTSDSPCDERSSCSTTDETSNGERALDGKSGGETK